MKTRKQLTSVYPPADGARLIVGGFMEQKLANEHIQETMNVNYTHDHVPNGLNASSLYYFNQDVCICSPHFDGEAGYFYMQSGLKVWIQIPIHYQALQVTQSWKLEDIAACNDRKWFILHPCDMVVVPAGVKYVVITLKPSVAYSGYFNNLYGSIDSINLWAYLRANNIETEKKIQEELKIDVYTINAIISATIRCLQQSTDVEQKENLRILRSKYKESLSLHAKNTYNKSIRTNLMRLVTALFKII